MNNNMKNSSTWRLFLSAALLGGLGLSAHALEEDAAALHPFETDATRAPLLDTSSGAVIQNVMIHTATQPGFLGTVTVKDGKITSVTEGSGKLSNAHAGLEVIDGTGMHLAPGVVDTHSHTAISGGVNEGTLSITADCDIS
ncbi:MAG: hypothetical protein ACJAZ8_002832, partial [Planctomycetota bacterium]